VKHKHLGSSGLLVSELCLGTMNFGWHTDEAESFAIMDRALELGINFFDTADVYGWAVEPGRTEEIIGAWFALGEGRREAVVLATKVYNPVKRHAARPEPNSDTRGLSAYKVRKHCHASLARLRTDRIELYQMHHVDRSCPWDELWPAFEALRTQGHIDYVGSSNFAGWDVATACQEASKRGLKGLVSEQSVYNLLQRQIESEVVPACRHYGVGLLPWSPLGGGLLAGRSRKGVRSEDDWLKAAGDNRESLEAYEALCRGLGEEPATVALAWLLHQPAVTAPVIGPRTLEQLESAVRATELTLEPEVLARLDEIFPGPGEAPENYSW
jgi:NDP-hexose 2,3-enoyl reductase